MAVTLREVLTFPPFVDAMARVLAGGDTLERPVRWVHSSEMPEVARLFSGHELLLTQGRGLSADPAQQRAWAGALADANIAGVALEAGVIHDKVPPAVVEEASLRGLPVIELTHPAYFMNMTQAVHGAIVNSRFDALTRAEEAGRRFTSLVLRGAGLQALLDQLASILGRPVVLGDRVHEVRAYAPGNDYTDRLLHGWTAHARQGHSYGADRAGVEQVRSAGITCTCQPIVFRGELWGSVHVLDDDPLDELGALALDRAVAAIGLAFAAAEGEQRQDDDVRSTLLQDLIHQGSGSRSGLTERAQALGVRLDGELRLVLLQPVDLDDPARPRGGSPREVRGVLHGTAKLAQQVLIEHGTHPLVGYYGSRVLAVFQDPVQPVSDLVALLHGAARRHAAATGEQLCIGISPRIGVDALAKATGEAEETVAYALRTRGSPGVHATEQLGIDRLLFKLDEAGVLADHIERELGRVLDHDASAGAPLLETLTVYLEESGHKTEAARRLHVERRTLYHRLERIQRLVLDDLNDADTRMRLLIAIRGLSYRRRAQLVR